MKIRTKMALTASTSPVIAKPWKSDFLSADALPDKDNSAPRECFLIRIAAPMAVQDELAREIITYQNKKLEPSDLDRLKVIFSDLESQFAKVSAIRNRVDGLAGGRISRCASIANG
jgi:hypothetical protein